MTIIILQPAMPMYRRALFELMAKEVGSGFFVYASFEGNLGALEVDRAGIEWLRSLEPLKSIIPGLEWQPGALSIPLSRGDTLVVSGAPRTVSTLVLIAKAKLLGVRVVWWGHYWSSTSKSWRASIRLGLMRLADSVVFYTDQEVDEYSRRYSVREAKPVIGLNNGLDAAAIDRYRTTYSSVSRQRDLIFIGRLVPKANLELLLQAMVLPACAHMHLDIVGDGPSRTALAELSVGLGVDSRVRWHGALVEESEIAKVANKCKAFVFPGNVGLSLIHGLSYGLPVVVHDNRWEHAPEIAALQVGVNGSTFRQGDAPSLAHVLASTLSDGAKLDAYSSAATETIRGSFNTVDMSRRFLSVLLNTGPGGAGVGRGE